MNSFLRNAGFYLLVIVIAVTAYDYMSVKPKPVEETSYSQFLQLVEQGEITKVTVVKNSIQATKKDGSEFTTIAPDEPIGDETLVGKLEAKGVEITAQNPKDPPWWMTLLTSLLPIALLVAFWYFMISQAQGGGGKVFSFGKSRAKLMGGDKVKVKFDDVAGADEAKEELAEVAKAGGDHLAEDALVVANALKANAQCYAEMKKHNAGLSLRRFRAAWNVIVQKFADYGLAAYEVQTGPKPYTVYGIPEEAKTKAEEYAYNFKNAHGLDYLPKIHSVIVSHSVANGVDTMGGAIVPTGITLKGNIPAGGTKGGQGRDDGGLTPKSLIDDLQI